MKMKNKTNQFLHAHCNNKGRRGYTLTEISLAVLILGIGLSGILSVFPVAISWGGGAIASKTGSLAARITVNHLEDFASGAESVLYLWEPDKVYAPGNCVFPTERNGYYYECVVGGKSNGPDYDHEPTWPPGPAAEGDEFESIGDSGSLRWKSHRAMIRVPEYPVWQPNTEYKPGDYVTPTMTKPSSSDALPAIDIKALRRLRFRCTSVINDGESDSQEPDWIAGGSALIEDRNVYWLRERYEGYYCEFFPRNAYPSEKHQWKKDRVYKKDDYIIIPALRLRAVCIEAGTSDGIEPDWMSSIEIEYDENDIQDNDVIKAGTEMVDDNTITWRCELIRPNNTWVADYKYFNDEDYVEQFGDPVDLPFDNNKPVDILFPLRSNYLYQCISAEDGISDDNPDNEPEWYDCLPGEPDLDEVSSFPLIWRNIGVNMVRPMVIQVHRQDPESDQYDEASDLLGVFEVSIYDYRLQP